MTLAGRAARYNRSTMGTRFTVAGLGRARGVLVALAVPAAVGLLTVAAGESALAQTRRPPARAAGKPAAKPAARGDGGTSSAMTATPGPAFVQPGGGGQSDSGVVESKTLDGGHAYKFTELDIEGRLKSPQLVYFLRRVRAEFSAGDLGHRSFMREMSETRKEPSF